MRQRVRNPKRGEERRGEFALTAQRGGREKRKGKREEGRRADETVVFQSLVEACTMAVCVSWRLPVSRTRLPIYHPR